MSKEEIGIFKQIDKEEIKRQIYEIRGKKVMFDKDIADYFEVTTGNLNKAMKRNIKRFPDSFCFQLSKEEYSRFQNGSLKQGQNIKYPPYVYTEQGVAMLTSALHTDRAIDASIQIMEAFVEMSHYIRQNEQLLPYQELQRLENNQYHMAERIQNIEDNMVTKSDLSDFMKLFDDGLQNEEILILDGEPFKADIAYQKIYGKAKKSVIIVDDYVGLKTLRHLAATKTKVTVTVISDNKGGNALKLSDYNDFLTEYPGRTINFLKSLNRAHDRYIVIDNGSKDMKLYHCGASSKDAGKRITTITRIIEMSTYKATISQLLSNPALVLK
ncbi:ORF6N domain-containing protein [Butyrivibrio sp. VCB2001]|uniref:ORF6N domain-containing protein n=1 Tax=Butyrivibrio sp. VCB2001 TaxID=1280667 RepID=UPI0003F97F4B|nr:ORF6N domain-containing protein [Butyrivibrio sp. VCB2001]